jgi:hypothetical protein
MNDEQFSRLTEILVKANEVSTEKIINKTVNGGIIELRKEVAAHHAFIKNHAQNDEEWQTRAEPMIKIFEDNNVVKMKLRSGTGTLVFYVSSLSVIGVATLWLWNQLKH